MHFAKPGDPLLCGASDKERGRATADPLMVTCIGCLATMTRLANAAEIERADELAAV